MNYICCKLSTFYNIQCYINFFTEYHNKNAVDGHFGILSHWFIEGEKIQNIFTINNLISLFQNKANKVSTQVDFIIYTHTEVRNKIERLIINNFQAYMSFLMINNKLLASTASYLDGTNYIEVSFKKIIIIDKRKTKYAPVQKRTNNISTIMGPRSKETLYLRIKLQNPQATSLM